MPSITVFDRDKWQSLLDTPAVAEAYATHASMLINRQSCQIVAASEGDDYTALFKAFQAKYPGEDALNYVAMPGPAALSRAAEVLDDRRKNKGPRQPGG